jgi:two-component SAPR family response regulator
MIPVTIPVSLNNAETITVSAATTFLMDLKPVPISVDEFITMARSRPRGESVTIPISALIVNPFTEGTLYAIAFAWTELKHGFP